MANEVQKQQAELLVNNQFIDGLSAQLEEKKRYGLTFPNDYNPTNALMGAYLILKEPGKDGKSIVDKCTQSSIANSLMDMVTMGVSAQKNQCYFISYGNKCRCQVSYHGNKTMAHRYGAKTICAEVIYEDDDFQYQIKNGKKEIVKHVQALGNIDFDKIIGAYCVVENENGDTYTEIMNMKQIEAAWNMGYGYKKSSTHKDFKDMMCKKTVTNRACRQIVQQYGDEFASETVEKLDEVKDIDISKEDAKYQIKQEENSIEFDEVVDEVPEDNAGQVPTEQEIVEESEEDGEVPDFMKGE